MQLSLITNFHIPILSFKEKISNFENQNLLYQQIKCISTIHPFLCSTIICVLVLLPLPHDTEHPLQSVQGPNMQSARLVMCSEVFIATPSHLVYLYDQICRYYLELGPLGWCPAYQDPTWANSCLLCSSWCIWPASWSRSTSPWGGRGTDTLSVSPTCSRSCPPFCSKEIHYIACTVECCLNCKWTCENIKILISS